MIAGAELEGGGWFGGLCSAACPFPDTAVCHGPVVIHWYHTCVNNMNKTDVIKIGPAPSPPPHSDAILLWGEKKREDGKWCCSSLTLSPPLSFALRLSFCFSSFHPSPLHSLGPQSCEAWLSTEAELSKLQGSAGQRSRRQKWATEQCLLGKYNCHISAYWATWSQINREIMQLHTAGKATLGGIKTEDRDMEEQIGSESRIVENLRDKVLTVGVFESVWQGGVKE